MKLILVLTVIAVVILSLVYISDKPQSEVGNNNATNTQESEVTGNIEEQRIVNPENVSTDTDSTSTSTQSDGKLKADTFVGTLEKVDTSCFADGECYVVVDGKHVTAIRGWSQDIVGRVVGVEGFGDLESRVGEEVEVYAQENSDGTYTLYGSEGFYIKVLK